MVKWPPAHAPKHRKLRYKQNRPFSDAIGAIDGTHIPCHPPEERAGHFRNRKGTLSFNVLAICDFDLRFTYVLSGAEGCEPDSSVFQLARSQYDLKIPDGKYVLGDAGYALRDGVLTPHIGSKYHLQQWRRLNREPGTEKDLYNFRHSSLRMCIERIFGVMKSRYKASKSYWMISWSCEVRRMIQFSMCFADPCCWISLLHRRSSAFDLCFVCSAQLHDGKQGVGGGNSEGPRSPER